MIARTLSHVALASSLFVAVTSPIVSAQGTTPAFAASPAARGDLLDRAVAAWARVKTARATFEQTIVNPLTGSTLKASGDYQQKRPGYLAVRFNDPATDRIVADGKYVWLYLPSTAPGQVIRSDLKATGTGTVDLTAQFLTSPRTRYTVSETGAGRVGDRATHGYLLVPKTKGSAPFLRASVQIDDVDATVRQFTVNEPSGIERTVKLTSFKTNVPVQASAFVFTPPAGTRLVVR